jgi:hypothetical protein
MAYDQLRECEWCGEPLARQAENSAPSPISAKMRLSSLGSARQRADISRSVLSRGISG